jgi:hypothetical protein
LLSSTKLPAPANTTAARRLIFLKPPTAAKRTHNLAKSARAARRRIAVVAGAGLWYSDESGWNRTTRPLSNGY